MEGSPLLSASPRQRGRGCSSWQQMGMILLDCPGQSFGGSFLLVGFCGCMAMKFVHILG